MKQMEKTAALPRWRMVDIHSPKSKSATIDAILEGGHTLIAMTLSIRSSFSRTPSALMLYASTYFLSLARERFLK